MKNQNKVISLDPRHYGRPPAPTKAKPFAQVEWIFNQRSNRAQNADTKSNYKSAKTFFISHVEAIHGRKPYFLTQMWDELAMVRFKQELDDRIDSGELKLASHTLTGYFSAIRQVMLEAAAYGLLDSITLQETAWGSAYRETAAHESYSESETAKILDAIASELTYCRKVIAGYTSQDQKLGRDPTMSPKLGRKRGFGWGVEANMRWYFEKVLQNTPIIGTGAAKKEHKPFLTSATNLHGGLHELYRRWGVAALIDENLIMPLAIELQFLTGLNPSSLLQLRVDCLKEIHPLTGMPYLTFVKERSQGEKELHLPLLDPREQRTLMRKQSLRVERVITSIKRLTKKVRDQLPAHHELKDHLFIYESTGPRMHKEICAITKKQTSSWCKRIVEKYKLTNDQHEPLAFNLVRFRSTKLTELALEGRDLFEIQQIARHKSIKQTFKYLAMNRLDVTGRKAVSEALQRIRENADEIKDVKRNGKDQIQPIHFYKGLVADCKNVFDPPERIKKTANYVEGQACTRFNMCLFCKNVVVLKEHLPSLAAYRDQIHSIKSNNIQNLPNSNHYDQTLAVIDDLLNPTTSQFSSEDIQLAIEMSTTLDIIVDPLLDRGVMK
jgi:hypothetical protein